MAWFAHQTVQLIHPTSVTERGSTRYDYTTAPTTETIERCIMDPQESGEADNGVLYEYTLRAPAGTNITEFDHVRFKGIDYEVVGKPKVLESPLGLVDGVTANLRTWRYGN